MTFLCHDDVTKMAKCVDDSGCFHFHSLLFSSFSLMTSLPRTRSTVKRWESQIMPNRDLTCHKHWCRCKLGHPLPTVVQALEQPHWDQIWFNLSGNSNVRKVYSIMSCACDLILNEFNEKVLYALQSFPLNMILTRLPSEYWCAYECAQCHTVCISIDLQSRGVGCYLVPVLITLPREFKSHLPWLRRIQIGQ